MAARPGLASAKEEEDGRAGAVALGFVDVAESPGDEAVREEEEEEEEGAAPLPSWSARRWASAASTLSPAAYTSRAVGNIHLRQCDDAQKFAAI